MDISKYPQSLQAQIKARQQPSIEELWKQDYGILPTDTQDERVAKRAAVEAKLGPPPPPPKTPESELPNDQNPRYSETTRWALGVTHTARKDIEILETNVRVFNSLKTMLDDPARLDGVRQQMGDEKGGKYIEKLKGDMAAWAASAREAASNITRSYSVTAPPLAVDASGLLRITDFTLKKNGPGWTVAIGAQGTVATVFAGGKDVSGLVDNRKMSGGVWVQRAPGQSTEIIV